MPAPISSLNLMEVINISPNQLDIKLILKMINLIDGDFDKFQMMKRFIKAMDKKYSSRILYGLHKLEFSGYWEILKLTNINDNRCIQQSVSILAREGIVMPITKDSAKYDFILKFWKETYRHSSRPPAFYRLHPNWTKLIQLLEPVFLKKFKGGNSIDMQAIEYRIELYDSYCAKSQAEVKALKDVKKNSIGQGKECENYIHK